MKGNTLGDTLGEVESKAFVDTKTLETLGKMLQEDMSKRLVGTVADRLAKVDVETYGNKLWRPRRSPTHWLTR